MVGASCVQPSAPCLRLLSKEVHKHVGANAEGSHGNGGAGVQLVHVGDGLPQVGGERGAVQAPGRHGRVRHAAVVVDDRPHAALRRALGCVAHVPVGRGCGVVGELGLHHVRKQRSWGCESPPPLKKSRG